MVTVPNGETGLHLQQHKFSPQFRSDLRGPTPHSSRRVGTYLPQVVRCVRRGAVEQQRWVLARTNRFWALVLSTTFRSAHPRYTRGSPVLNVSNDRLNEIG
jgi:hypothetical protein